MATSIFVSHSKSDEDIVNFFTKSIARVGFTPQLMELEDLKNEYDGIRISEIIRSNSSIYENTRAVIVLLGPNIINPPTNTPQFTHNWVNFEVGVAAGCNKPVWVFEQFGEFIQFPIPYVTDYCRYDITSTEHLRNIGEFFKIMINQPTNYGNQFSVTCNFCKATYGIWDNENQLNCPVCRNSIAFTR